MSFLSSLSKNIFSIIGIILLFSLIPLVTKVGKKWYEAHIDIKHNVAIIEVKGALNSSTSYTRQLRKQFEDTTIEAIVLKMECPGSAAGTGQIIFQEINELKKIYPKPIITVVENLCASGGYYIACATDAIIAPPSAMVGSIGTVFPYLFQLEKFLEYHNISSVPLKAGEYKMSGSPFTNITEKEKALLQSLLDDSYAQFTEDVARCRNIDLAQASIWAEGKIFTARQAHALSLIDHLGNVSMAEKVLKEKLGTDKEIRWIQPEKPSGLSALFGSSDEGPEGNYFTTCINAICSIIEQRYQQSIIKF